MPLFFELIQISLCKRDVFTIYPTDNDWKVLFEQAKRQALIGVLFSGVERLPEGQRPPKNILLQWYALVQQIENRNKILNDFASNLFNKFQRADIRSCILKGQGNAAIYTNPLRRQSGDIDVWIDSKRNDIINYISSICKPNEIRWHHMDFPINREIEIEVHFMPTWMFNPFTNKKLQKWFAKERNKQFEHKIKISNNKDICIPTREFNLIYQLIHIYRHLFDEGIGLRQLMDYYFLLWSWGVRNKESDTLNYEVGIMNYEEGCRLPIRNDEIIRLLKSLKLEKFAGAVMWVLGEVFGLERELMLVVPNEKEGRFLLDEIMMAGNFGHFDERKGNISNESTLHLFVRKQKHALRFFMNYPSEILWSPYFTIKQRVWRWHKGFI